MSLQIDPRSIAQLSVLNTDIIIANDHIYRAINDRERWHELPGLLAQGQALMNQQIERVHELDRDIKEAMQLGLASTHQLAAPVPAEKAAA